MSRRSSVPSMNRQLKHISVRPSTGRLSTYRSSNNVLVRHLSLLNATILCLFASQTFVAVPGAEGNAASAAHAHNTSARTGHYRPSPVCMTSCQSIHSVCCLLLRQCMTPDSCPMRPVFQHWLSQQHAVERSQKRPCDCAALHTIAVQQHQTNKNQNASLANLQRQAQALMDGTTDMTVQLVLFKCYLDTADRREKRLQVGAPLLPVLLLYVLESVSPLSPAGLGSTACLLCVHVR